MTGGMEMEDKTGQMRDPEDFIRARAVIAKRLVKVDAMTQDPELFMEFTTIIEALEIAAAVSTAARKRRP